MWIDFNNNFVFETTERVASGVMSGTSNTLITVTIPSTGAGAVVGVHRMRASLAYYYVPDPCGAGNPYGETHDYTVNIITCKLFHF
jgi:hypothetical protein